MLRIVVPAIELWDEEKQQFVSTKETVLDLEHSLVSISKWESKWHKAFLGRAEKTQEEVMDYVRCMLLNKNVDPTVLTYLTEENVTAINKYIEDPMTATTFSDDKSARRNREIVTSEIIYYWMVAHNIPSEYEKWHLNRLMTLIRICNIKNAPPKKRGTRETLSQYAAINAARRKQAGITR